MERLIYYPGFESTNEDWLKFALLYIDKLSPIVPPRLHKKYSSLYSQITSESDLIVQHPPAYQDGYLSALDTIEILKRIEADPYSFDQFFKDANVVRAWRSKNIQNYTLYREKYSHELAHYCVENGYATENDNGIRIPESLGILYMTVLANRIADDKNISPITDYTQLDDLSFFLKKTAPVVTAETVNAKGIISLKLPAKINKLKLGDVLKLRNSNGFKENQAAFHKELKSFLAKLETGDYSGDFIDKYNKAGASFTEQILAGGSDVLTVGLGTWMLLSKVAPGLDEVLKVATAATGVVIKQGFSISKAWKNTQQDRNCRRYLASLENFPLR
jgi:hypothetical protein